MCDQYVAECGKDVVGKRGLHFTIYDNSGEKIGWLMRGGGSALFGYGLDANHSLFVNTVNEDFMIVVNEKYGSLTNMKVSYARNGDNVDELEYKIQNSSLCLLYPSHTMMPKDSFLNMYKKFGVVNGMHYLYNCNRDYMEENVVNQLNSSKRFKFQCNGVDYVTCTKCANNDFMISFNEDVFSQLHAFLLFLSFCF